MLRKCVLLAIAIAAVLVLVGCSGKKEKSADSGQVAASGQDEYLQAEDSRAIYELGLQDTEKDVKPQNFVRVIELQTPRMNGPDIAALQKRLLSLGYDSVGEADGYYGPATEKVIKYIQLFLGGGYLVYKDGKVDQSLWEDIFYEDFNDWNRYKRASFADNIAIDASTVLDVFQKFIGWKDIDGYYYQNESDTNRDPHKIADGLLNNREYVYTYSGSYANTDYEWGVGYYFVPEHNLVLRGDDGENAPRREFRLLDFRKFIYTVYNVLNGYHDYDEIYDFDPQTGVFTLLETIYAEWHNWK